jgi:LysM repeat protein
VKRACQIFLLVLCSSLQAADASSNVLSHRIQGCETEVEMLKNSISTQEQAREALEKEVSSLLRATRESIADAREGSSQRQKSFDKTIERLTQDLKQLKSHSNELSQTINDLAKTVQGIKDTEHQQGQAIKELEQAMRALTIALGGKASSWKPTSDSKTTFYTVKNGDSLERIARAHGMTLSEIKELNALKSATIHPGQELTVRQP